MSGNRTEQENHVALDPDNDLLAQIRQEQEAPMKCPVGRALEKLPDSDRRGLVAALADPQIFGTSIEKVLAARGFKIGRDGVQRHRRNVCSCPA